MQLSSAVKALKPSATLAAAARAKALKAQGVTVYDFTVGEPDFTTPDHICAAASQAMEAGHTHYTPATGILDLKQAVCGVYQRDYGLHYEPANVVIGNGAKHILHNVLMSLCGPGDEVIIPTPYWVSYGALVELCGATPVLVPTTQADGFCLSARQFAEHITNRTRLMILNNPCNPTGAVYPVETLQQLADVAVERRVPVIADEIYEKLIYPGTEFRPFASLRPEVKDLTITVSGVSKAYAMTGWRIGWSLAPIALTQAMSNLQSQQTSNPCSISQYAALAALTGPQDCVQEMLAAFVERRNYVVRRLEEMPEISFAHPGGAFYVFFDVSGYFGKTSPGGRRLIDSSEFCSALLDEAHVALVSGDDFGAPGYARLSFAAGLSSLEVGLDQLAEFLKGAG